MPGTSSDPREAPAPDVLEVSLFGPGVGECVVVHIGHGEWLVVDSCVERPSGRPVALHYLESCGVDVATAIKLIVLTHWHDDHVHGASAVLAAAQAARIACSAALRRSEFLQLVTGGERAMMVSPGTAEFGAIFEILRSRAPAGVRPATVGPVWANADQVLWRSEEPSPVPARVWALSPSAATVTLGWHELSRLLPGLGTPKRRLVSQEPNELAVVLWIEAGALRVLLGSDLERSSNAATGWQAIVTSPTRPRGRAHVFKVPHHGSENADDPEVWTHMLVPGPHAALTPFSRGRGLPQPGDIARLRSRTPYAYCTARPGGWRPLSRDNAVERTLRGVVRQRKALTGPMGHVRIRAQLSSPESVTVDLFEGAYRA